MVHFQNNPVSQIVYVLYAHYPDLTIGEKKLTVEDLSSIIGSSATKLEKYTEVLKADFNIKDFLQRFKFIIAPSFDTTVEDVKGKLLENGIESGDVDLLIYPNALTMIGDLSIQKEEEKRKITKAELIAKLVSIRTIEFSRWTAALKNFDKLIKEKRKQLKSNLDKNARVRHILLSQELENFAEEIVIFIQDFLQKFHFKPCHLNTPLFCFDCDAELFKDIRKRIIAKKHKFNDGFLVDEFNKSYLFRDPVTNPSKKLREFDLRITTLAIAPDILEETVCDDLYLVAPKDNYQSEPVDVNVERLAVRNFKELRFIFGME